MRNSENRKPYDTGFLHLFTLDLYSQQNHKNAFHGNMFLLFTTCYVICKIVNYHFNFPKNVSGIKEDKVKNNPLLIAKTTTVID